MQDDLKYSKFVRLFDKEDSINEFMLIISQLLVLTY